MHDNLWSALGGGVFTLIVAYLTQKWTADREDRRRLSDVSREKAAERIQKFYKPVLDMLDPGPCPEEYGIDRKLGGELLDFVDKNELFASPGYLEVIYRFRKAYNSLTGEVDRDLQFEVYNFAWREYEELKALQGFGKIIMTYRVKKRVSSYFSDKIQEAYFVCLNKGRSFRKKKVRRRL